MDQPTIITKKAAPPNTSITKLLRMPRNRRREPVSLEHPLDGVIMGNLAAKPLLECWSKHCFLSKSRWDEKFNEVYKQIIFLILKVENYGE
jgi:hypothetical protein